jgi:hypothetical protein
MAYDILIGVGGKVECPPFFGPAEFTLLCGELIYSQQPLPKRENRIARLTDARIASDFRRGVSGGSMPVDDRHRAHSQNGGSNA